MLAVRKNRITKTVAHREQRPRSARFHLDPKLEVHLHQGPIVGTWGDIEQTVPVCPPARVGAARRRDFLFGLRTGERSDVNLWSRAGFIALVRDPIAVG